MGNEEILKVGTLPSRLDNSEIKEILQELTFILDKLREKNHVCVILARKTGMENIDSNMICVSNAHKETVGDMLLTYMAKDISDKMSAIESSLINNEEKH
jgi:hypothetical protein